MANIAIWKDKYLGLGTSPRSYLVKLGGNTIYAGLAFTRPGEGQPYTKLNDIAAPYLKQTIPIEGGDSMEDDYVAADIFLTFKVYASDGVTQIGSDASFFYDWSGDPDHNTLAATVGCHANITGKCARHAPLIYTLYNTAPISSDSNNIKVRSTSNTGGTTLKAWQGVGNYVLADPDASLANIDTWIQIGRLRLDVVDCIRYVVYYVNAYGGWDELPIEGAVREWREYEKHYIKRVYNNASTVPRGEVNYANEESRFWEMTTGWLTDDQASRMHHLIGSPLVYLYDIDTQILRPVVVTDTQVENREYTREGKPIFYSFTLKEAREGMRR